MLIAARMSPEADAAWSRLVQRGPEAAHEICRQLVKGRVAGMQRVREPVLGGDELGEAVEPFFESDPRCVLGHQRWCRIGAGIDLALKHSFDQI